MPLKTLLKSNEDRSVNFVFENKTEARFVQRQDDYFIVYLSSQNGCNKACRFCHLTQTGQTSFEDASLQDFIEQASTVLDYYDQNKTKEAQIVHFNFMARGEPFANRIILENSKELLAALENLASKRSLKSKFLFSSIFPQELETLSLNDVFKNCSQEILIYYSLYSVNTSFRKKWIPKSLAPGVALKKLAEIKDMSNIKIGIHGAFIEGENDSPQDIENMKRALTEFEIPFRFNLVRYNPFSNSQGVETNFERLEEILKEFKQIAQESSRIVPRVGFDVKASCGMFIEIKSIDK